MLAGCASSGPRIRHEANPNVPIASYRSFGFFSPLATDNAGYEAILTTRLKTAVRREMEAKGYTYAETGAQILVNFFVNVENRQEIQSSPVSFGYYGYRRGFYTGLSTGPDITTVNYEQGTLTIDLVDPGKKALAWQATAIGKVSKAARKNPTAAIDAVVKDMLAPLPAPGG